MSCLPDGFQSNSPVDRVANVPPAFIETVARREAMRPAASDTQWPSRGSIAMPLSVIGSVDLWWSP